MSDSSSPFLTLSQVAARTGRHPELLRQWCAAGRIPCHRLGGSWVVREDDLALVGRMATRTRRRTVVETVSSGRRVLVAAVFDDSERAGAATSALRNRLGLENTSIESAPLGIPALAALGLTVVAGEIPEEATLDARRVLSSYGGRIVAELDGSTSVPQPAARAGRRRVAAAR